jgi:hypothetical protein
MRLIRFLPVETLYIIFSMRTMPQSLDSVVPDWEPLEFRAAMLSTVEGADEAAASALEAGADETAWGD